MDGFAQFASIRWVPIGGPILGWIEGGWGGLLGKCLSSGSLHAVLDERGARFSPSLARRMALAAIVAVGQIGPISAQNAPADSTPPSRGSPEQPTRLPPVTVDSKRERIAKPKPALVATRAKPTTRRANVPALPDGVALNGGPPVTQTTAGPVSGYRALTSVSATGTDTPIERIPQAVAVVPRAVLDDQQPLGQMDALRNISAVTPISANTFIGYAYKVRGFPADRYVDGLPNYYDGGDNTSLRNTERIEVLKGPAGILYQGGIGPVGGIINTVSKLPTENRFAEIGFTAGG